MILDVSSSLPRFKPVTFHCGINIFLADTADPAKDGRTRNSSGKTSLVEIIHFLLGAKVEDGSLYRSAALEGAWFYGRFQLAKDIWHVGRRIGDANKIVVREGNAERYGIKLKEDAETEQLWMNVATWRELLGHCYFDLPFPRKNSAFDTPNSPTFRSLLGYFARRHLDGGFVHADRYSENMQKIDAAIALSYLLGLDWQLPQAFVRIADRRRMLAQLLKAAKSDLFEAFIGKASELRPQLVAAEMRADKLRNEVASFRVVESYKRLAAEASERKTDMQRYSRRLTALRENLAALDDNLATESPPSQVDVASMYSAIGIQIPGVSLRRFDDVQRFHASVIENRRTHLQRERDRVVEEIENAEAMLASVGQSRTAILETLDGAGALSDLRDLQKQQSDAEGKARALEQRLKVAQQVESEETQIQIDALQLEKRLQDDLTERQSIVAAVQRRIVELGNLLYEDRDVSLEVDVSGAGPEFRIRIPGDHGGGIHNVETFLLDMTLFLVAGERFGHGRFLIHDSHLFDGVDERQVAKCLVLGRDAAWSAKGQYIVTMNSDQFNKLPKNLWSEGDKYTLATRVTDADEESGLFGMRFET